MATLAELEQRIDELEQLVGSDQSDQLFPNVLTVAADGSIGADFTGHIHAKGVDLDAGTTGAPPDANKVRWIRTSDGAVVAQLFTYETGPLGDNLRLDVLARDPANNADLILYSQNANGSHSVFLELVSSKQTGGSAAATQLLATLDTIRQVVILDGNGASSFPKLLAGTTAEQKIIGGTVNANGTIAAGVGFTVSHLALGQYRVTFTPTAFTNSPYIVLSTTDNVTNATNNISLHSRSNSQFDAFVTNPASTAFIDQIWDFVAMGL